MFKVRFHARAGQGAKSAAQILAEAANEEGKYVQAFPEYGPERMGAPMQAFTKIDSAPIKEYEPVNEPDAVVVIDDSLLMLNITKGANGPIIVNTKRNAKDIAKEINYNNVCVLDAADIALKTAGKEGMNTVMLGALLKVTNIIRLENVEKMISRHFLKKLGKEKTDANIMALNEGYKQVK